MAKHVEIATRRNELNDLCRLVGMGGREILGSAPRRAAYDSAARGADLRVSGQRKSGSVLASLWASCSRPGPPAVVEMGVRAKKRQFSRVPD